MRPPFPIAKVAPLSPTQTAVLWHVCRGRTIKEAAEALGIKYLTANSSVGGAYKKLGVHTRRDATLRAVELGIVPKNEAAYRMPGSAAKLVKLFED